MEHMTPFTSGLKTPTRMLLDASSRGTLRIKNEYEVNTLIKNMCQNESRLSNRGVKQKGVLTVDLKSTLLS